MTEFQILSWRDIPAQIIVGKGRNAVKVQLSERFEKAIDKCAMKIGATDSESYMEDWRKSNPMQSIVTSELVASFEAQQIENIFTNEKLTELIENNGWKI